MVLNHVLSARCPNCHKGPIFKDGRLISLNMDNMNARCPNCNFNLAKEPGYYWGAMYASYGLTLVEIFLAYFICQILGAGKFDWINLWVIFGTILILAPFNFRLGRVIWLYTFP